MTNLIFIAIIAGLVGRVWFLRKKIKELDGQIKAVSREKEEVEKLGSGLTEYAGLMQQRKEAQKAKIVETLKNKGKITNRDVEKDLGVSDATATRYLDELEKEGKIVQKGLAKGTYYILA